MSRFLIPSIALATLLGTPGLAQDALVTPLPAICTANAGHAMAMPPGHEAAPADDAHRDLTAGMEENDALMMQGATAVDIDVAFVCAMIPHHQSAINMARAELAHGDDAWARELAEKVIAAQQEEIDEMLAWLADQGQ
jgi:uncharacterized protein (DUF305 family)